MSFIKAVNTCVKSFSFLYLLKRAINAGALISFKVSCGFFPSLLCTQMFAACIKSNFFARASVT
jgi:hypothetical protein